ncbi:hypothetical protein EVAR_77774_1 [Eumeta japonica]|uniref:Uncharacterized protein n=1 Tax=Eumeta variegata TaxID=151549 RepID=A0A4C1TAX2_EUMVA|nr:hypothetical protein EVAR_77774_1 [Eumeta japonica]
MGQEVPYDHLPLDLHLRLHLSSSTKRHAIPPVRPRRRLFRDRGLRSGARRGAEPGAPLRALSPPPGRASRRRAPRPPKSRPPPVTRNFGLKNTGLDFVFVVFAFLGRRSSSVYRRVGGPWRRAAAGRDRKHRAYLLRRAATISGHEVVNNRARSRRGRGSSEIVHERSRRARPRRRRRPIRWCRRACDTCVRAILQINRDLSPGLVLRPRRCSSARAAGGDR